VAVSVCETRPSTGACLAPPGSAVTRVIDQGETPTFGVFVSGTGPVPFDPAVTRIFVRFTEDTVNGTAILAVTRGATSVAVRTQ
jgi:hypothetical protein